MKISERYHLENNKLIAEFIGFKYYPNSKDDFGKLKPHWSIASSISHHYIYDYDFIDDIKKYKFHKSWDWLMPVVEEICSLTISKHKHRINVTIKRGFCIITYQDSMRDQTIVVKSVDRKDGKNTLEVVYAAIVDFINLYNINKKDYEMETI